MRRLSVDHPLFDPRDPDGYVRFKSAMIFDTRKKESRKALKLMLFGHKHGYHSATFSEEMDFATRVSDSLMSGTFIEEYFLNMDQFLSKKAIRKFFKQR